MDVKEILAHCDHTLLKQESTWGQIKAVCDDGLKYECASVCIPASFVKQAADYVGNDLKICTVIGFPNGYSTTAVKVFETEDAIRNGADEIDMVINIGWVKDKRWDDLLEEIKSIKASCQGRMGPTISRPPPAFLPAVLPGRMWPSSRPTWVLRCVSRPLAASAPFRMLRTSSTWAPTAWVLPPSSSW